MEHHDILVHKTLVGIIQDLETLGQPVTATVADALKGRLSLAIASAQVLGTRMALLRLSADINRRNCPAEQR